MQTIRHLLSLIRFSHTVFALPFALLAAVMAWSIEGMVWRWQDLMGVQLCMVTARSAAMAMNRLIDRSIDAENPRTVGRHLPAGILKVNTVRLFALLSCVGFVAATLLFLPNRLPLYLAVPVLLFLIGYSYTKRFTWLAHFWLGTALGLAPVATWIALRGEFVMNQPTDLLPALVLGAAVLSWVAGFDIIYACQDAEFDREAGLRSVPAWLGVTNSLRLAAVCHLVTIVMFALLSVVFPSLGWIYKTGVGLVAVLLVVEHAMVKPNDLTRVNIAFFNINSVISLGLFAVGTLDLWLGGR